MSAHERLGLVQERRTSASRLGILMQGWLEKKSGGKRGKWKSLGNLQDKWDRRFFVLSVHGTLAYYKSDSDVLRGISPHGVVDCRGGTVGQMDADDVSLDDDNGFQFTLNTRDRVLMMRAQSEQEVEVWAAALGPVVARSMKQRAPASPYLQPARLLSLMETSSPDNRGSSSSLTVLPPPEMKGTVLDSIYTVGAKAARALNPPSIIAAAKKKLIHAIKQRVHSRLLIVYMDKLKPMLTQDRRVPWQLRQMIHDLADEVWANVQYEIDRAFQKMIEAQDVTDDAGEDTVASQVSPPATPIASPPTSPPPPPATPAWLTSPPHPAPPALERPPSPPLSPPATPRSVASTPRDRSSGLTLDEDIEGKLQVCLLMGWGFFAAKRDGLPNVFVRLSLRGKAQQSRVVATTLAPVWGASGQVFEWQGSKDDLMGSTLELQVMDKQRLGSYVMASARVDLSQLASTATAVSTLVPCTTSSGAPLKPALRISTASVAPSRASCISPKGLPPKLALNRFTEENGSCLSREPSVVTEASRASLLSSDSSRQSAVSFNTSGYTQEGSRTSTVNVLDPSTPRRESALTARELDVPMAPEGKLRLRFRWMESTPPKLSNTMRKYEDDPRVGITVTLISGQGLLAADSNGLSDPYCILRLGNSRKKSRVIPMTLNPVWEQEFEFAT